MEGFTVEMGSADGKISFGVVQFGEEEHWNLVKHLSNFPQAIFLLQTHPLQENGNGLGTFPGIQL